MSKMGGTNAIIVLVLFATSLATALAQNEANFGAEDVARESDVLAIKSKVSAMETMLIAAET